MAERRMFAKKIVTSARFLKMPPSSRLLYYDLGMNADDDGVAESWTVMRQTGSTEDDLRVLIAKGFVKLLNEDLVVYITDWSKNNFIRKDRYQEGEYHELLVQFQTPDELLLSDGQPNVSQVVDRGKDSIDKDSIGKDRLTDTDSAPSLDAVKIYMTEKGCQSGSIKKFYEAYSAKSWYYGKKPWKQLADDWIERDKRYQKTFEEMKPQSEEELKRLLEMI